MGKLSFDQNIVNELRTAEYLLGTRDHNIANHVIVALLSVLVKSELEPEKANGIAAQFNHLHWKIRPYYRPSDKNGAIVSACLSALAGNPLGPRDKELLS